MRVLKLLSLSIIGGLFLESCALLAAYALIQTVRDINNMLDTANSSITRIGRILDEGKEIEKAADDGNLLTALAEEIPALVRDQVEQPIREEVGKLATNLKETSTALTKMLLCEDIVGSKNAYANVIRSYNDLVDFANSYNETY